MNTMLIGRGTNRDGNPTTDVQAFDVIVTQEDLDFAHEAVHAGNVDDAHLLLHSKGSDIDSVVAFIKAHPIGVTMAVPPKPSALGTLS